MDIDYFIRECGHAEAGATKIDNEDRLKLIFHYIADACFIWSLGSDGNIHPFVEVNETACTRYGYTRDEFLKMSPIDLAPDSLKSAVLIAIPSLRTTKSFLFETYHQTKTGELIPVEINTHVLEKNGDHLVISIVRDIRERKKLLQKQKEQEQLIANQTRVAALGEMIGVLAEQWRQPLNTLGVLFQDISESLKEGESLTYVDDAVYKAMDRIRYLSQTIDDFRDFYKVESKIQTFRPADAVARVQRLLAPIMEINLIDLIVSYPFDEEIFKELRISNYRHNFEEILLSLVKNGIDSILLKREKQTPTTDDPKDSINLKIHTTDESLIVDVEISGDGRSNIDRDKIFESHVRAKPNEYMKLGLTAAKKTARDTMGGDLTLLASNESSSNHKATTFRFKVARVALTEMLHEGTTESLHEDIGIHIVKSEINQNYFS